MGGSAQFDRRGALGLLGAGLTTLNTAPVLARSVARNMPWLYTPEQFEAERMLLRLAAEPAVRRIQAAMRAELIGEARYRIPAAARTLDRALRLWTNSLIMGQLTYRPDRPRFLWGTDDTPRQWLGHTIPGIATSGDNPDAIYRTAGIAGGSRYEIRGQYHPSGPPTQLLIELNQGDMTKPQNIMPTAGGSHADIRNAAQINDKQIVPGKDGSFVITVGGEDPGFNHLAVPPSGRCVIGVRDILSDWRQRPARLSIRRLDAAPSEPWNYPLLRARTIEDLRGFLRFWSHFPDIWFGGLKPNTHSAPMGRPGGWGYVAGLNFSLKQDEAMLVTIAPGGSKYTGFQINDPWMVAPDARARQVCLNISQSTPSADGTVGYVISKVDTGHANWLDTDGMDDGLGIIRWQAIPQGLPADGLIREVRVVKRAELSALGLPMVTAEERRRRVAARWADYSFRAT